MKVFSTILFLFIFHISFVNTIEWQELNAATFTRAKAENKIILLNLKANWCHWCHVMKNNTYTNQEVVTYINKHFITVEADQDANPELSNRYKDYGWPATIFINAKGEDVVKRAGYMAPENFLRLLKAIIKDPSPEQTSVDLTTINNTKNTNNNLVATLENNFIKSLDIEVGGFNQAQKYIEYATFEKALLDRKNLTLNTWIKNSVKGAKKLSDPVWGGMYQYSTHNDWEHVHFEKLLSIQARYINIFLQHYTYYNDENSLKQAKNIVHYIDTFLANKNGLYSNAQDADLIQGRHAGAYFALNNTERRKLGIPNIDKNTFTDNNATIGSALLRMYNGTQNKKYLNKVKTIENGLYQRKNRNGLYTHGSKQSTVSSLKDQIAMAHFFINLIKNDINNTKAKQELKALCLQLKNKFLLQNGSFISFTGNNGLTTQPLKEENISLARIFNWYGHYTHNKEYINIAKHTYKFLTADVLAKNYYSEASLLLLQKELATEPNQYVYLNTEKGNHFNYYLQSITPFYSLVYVGKLNELPTEKQNLIKSFKENVLFSCTSNYCSTPIYSEEELKKEFYKNN
ncbi:hypothetical protein FHR24_000682 [Wenyingzhuangia heitensis]|uniref:Spermatogenesis-associated protein 20-like TRX domain-containing protein n=1 Tax=Wenyingzhuangia heitensis TaxID=1487859 RepID=A0ABX0U654_9FLAO|nr:DUF255 domain-containing protein [Wenyingzhuangia heitensis]NIJ44243.1 hypothetical protein [Wenyingzhuangia heitensis]